MRVNGVALILLDGGPLNMTFSNAKDEEREGALQFLKHPRAPSLFLCGMKAKRIPWFLVSGLPTLLSKC